MQIKKLLHFIDYKNTCKLLGPTLRTCIGDSSLLMMALRGGDCIIRDPLLSMCDDGGDC